MKRITRKNLENLVNTLNKVTGHSTEAYSNNAEHLSTGRPLTANIGTYVISGAYGGWALHQMDNESGGERDVLSTGHIPARELFNLIHAYWRGMEVGGLYDNNTTKETN